jgi:hypothetical protein
MKVSVTRSGGFAGLTQTWSCDVDERDDEWNSVLAELPWDDRPRNSSGHDRYVYRIGVSRRRITLPEQRVDGPWRELVEKVRASADNPQR